MSRKAGFPVWSRAFISSGNFSQVNARILSDSSELALIPFVKDDENTTNAILFVHAKNQDTSFKLMYALNYETYGFDFSDTTQLNARNVFHLFTLMDKAVFGYSKFKVNDRRIITGNLADTTSYLFATLRDSLIEPTNENKTIAITVCNTYQVCGLCAFREVEARDRCCNPTYPTICTTVVIYTGDGEGGGGGGGSGGQGNWEDENPCRGMPNQNDPCGSGGGSGVGGGNPNSPGWEPEIEDEPGSHNPGDTLIAKTLNRAYLKVVRMADSLHIKSEELLKEHTFTLVNSGNDTVAMWPRIGQDISSLPFLGQGSFGFVHAHYDTGPSDPNKNCGFDGPDIYKMYFHNNRNQAATLQFVTTRDFVYAAVITDVNKFLDFTRTLSGSTNIVRIQGKMHQIHVEAMNACSGIGCTWQKKTEMGMLAITANNDESVSGISIYKSPRQEINFTLLTP